jgi:ribulose-phosphate 3-epimerase
MVDIVPAVLPKNYEDLKNKLALVRGYVQLVQVDICDGNFVKNITWPFDKNSLDQHFNGILNEEEGMPFWEDMDFEFDLMVSDAVENFHIYSKLGAKSLIFHVEAMEDLENFKNFLEGIDLYVRDIMEIGIAINTTTDIEKIFPLVPFVDFVQVMGIEHVGFQGQDFDERSILQIKKLKETFADDITISVDGAVNLETAPKFIEAGANKLVIGSAIFDAGDIIGTIEEFKNL